MLTASLTASIADGAVLEELTLEIKQLKQKDREQDLKIHRLQQNEVRFII